MDLQKPMDKGKLGRWDRRVTDNGEMCVSSVDGDPALEPPPIRLLFPPARRAANASARVTSELWPLEEIVADD
jgi:hypothetical protein